MTEVAKSLVRSRVAGSLSKQTLFRIDFNVQALQGYTSHQITEGSLLPCKRMVSTGVYRQLPRCEFLEQSQFIDHFFDTLKEEASHTIKVLANTNLYVYYHSAINSI